MTKNKSNNKRKRVSVVKGMRGGVQRPGLNREALNYKKLLADPCNSSLINPYGDDEGAQVSRWTDMGLNTFNNEVWVIHPVLGSYFAGAVSDATSVSLAVNTAVYNPTGLATRGIAGCLSVSYIGAENSRAGLTYCGIIPGAQVWNFMPTAIGGGGGSFTIKNLAARLQNMERMPVDKCEVNWIPSAGDDERIPPLSVGAGAPNQFSATEVIFSRVNFAIVVVQGAPAVGAVQFKITGVAERGGYISTDASVPFTITPAQPKTFSWRTVLESLAAADSTWYLNTFKKMGHLGLGAVGAYATAGLPGALGYLTAGFAGITTKQGSVPRKGY